MRKIILFLLTIAVMFNLTACKAKNSDIELNPDGSVRPGTDKTVVNFWGWGDEEEVAVFRSLVDRFNSTNAYNIEVKYTQKPSNNYDSSMELTLNGSKPPDVFYVGDGKIKTWAHLGYLKPLDEYMAAGTLDTSDMWETAISRYRYNVRTTSSLPTDPLYGLAKDIGPTVVYYNADALRAVGVNIISKDEKDAAAAEARGYDPATKTFNNKIAMTFEDSLELFKLLTKSYNAASPCDYGYFNEWWFNYGWSVGGDVIKMNAAGDWEFSLGDTTPNYIKDGQFVTNPQGAVRLPSTRDMFTEFVRLSAPKSMNVDGAGKYGYEVTPNPNAVSTDGKVGYFTSGKVAMLVDGRWSVPTLRKNADFDWDVAPLPKHRDGLEAGHSGSMALSISIKSKVPNAAFKFIEYISGPEGQKAQAETGFNIPNQKSIAASEVFLQSDRKPQNAEIFLRAAAVQRPGDWALLRSNEWIDEWAPVLNNEVRNGTKTLPQFFDTVTARTNKKLLEYTKG